MKINHQMSIHELQMRMGDATNDEARFMRDVLVDTEYVDTMDIPEHEWYAMCELISEIIAEQQNTWE